METFKKEELYAIGNKLFGVKHSVITGQSKNQYQTVIYVGGILKAMVSHCFGSSVGLRLSIWKLSIHIIIGID
mgnify:CR=1 FL=1